MQQALLKSSVFLFALFLSTGALASSYADLLGLFEDWRDFESPPLFQGAPDYRAATNAQRAGELKAFQARLNAMDIAAWPIAEQVDWHLVRAEMNGMEFNLRVLRPWARDPAFYQSVWTYQSDTPAHEGPTHHALIELWTYDFPLSDQDAQRLAGELDGIPPLLAQARSNLTGNARELWIAGIANMRDQAASLAALSDSTRRVTRRLPGPWRQRAGDGPVYCLAGERRGNKKTVRPASASRTTPGPCATCTTYP